MVLMKLKVSKLAARLAAPIVGLGLMLGMVAQQRQYLREADFAPFHERAYRAIDSIPWLHGSWNSVEVPPSPEAQKLLKPNIILSRLYTDISSVGRRDANGNRLPERQASLLIVQCKRSNDMVGHYPPICYRAQGHEIERETARTWQVGPLTVHGMEYGFKITRNGQVSRTSVYNFMIVPGVGFARDMKGVEAAAEDYQQRYYGAAQVQVIFDAAVPQAERDQMFAELLAPASQAIELLKAGVLHEP
jgi:hypothetical protein